MIQTLLKRLHPTNQDSVLDTVLLSSIFIVFFYLVSDFNDVVAYKEMALIVLTVITLFSGTLSGLVSLLVMTLGLYILKDIFDEKLFLKFLIFVLIFGEFHFHWLRRNRKILEEKEYLKQKFRSLSNAFFTLKMSHDQLEKGYLLKPVTLRSVLIDLAQSPDDEKNIPHLFQTFQEAFSVHTASYFRLDSDANVLETFRYEENAKTMYDKEHRMIDKALLTKKSVFLAESSIELLEKEPILAVLPILDRDEKIIAMAVIEEMDFLSFNKDNILKIQILLEYFEDEIANNKKLQREKETSSFQGMDATFYSEVLRLDKMQRHHNVQSSLLIVKTDKDAVKLTMDNFTMRKMRFMDMITTLEIENTLFYLFLLPFEDIAGANGFKQRLRMELESYSKEDYEIMVSEVEKLKQVQAWMKASAT